MFPGFRVWIWCPRPSVNFPTDCRAKQSPLRLEQEKGGGRGLRWAAGDGVGCCSIACLCWEVFSKGTGGCSF